MTSSKPFVWTPEALETDEMRVASMWKIFESECLDMVARNDLKRQILLPIPRGTSAEAVASVKAKLEAKTWQVKEIETGFGLSSGSALAVNRPRST